MPNDHLELLARAKAIRDDVNLLEGLHKTCQLTEIGLVEPILNETRYLARALADILFFDVGTEEYRAGLKNAEHAVRCAINDAIDALVTFVKSALLNIKIDHPDYNISVSPFGKQYIALLTTMSIVEEKIISSRVQREKRYELYKNLAENRVELEAIAKFALVIPQIEATTKINTPGFARGAGDHPSDAWLLDNMRQALGSNPGEAKFSVEFQPKYECVGTNPKKCVGAEALLRLKIGEANISPVDFIKYAERSGLIIDIGQHVMRETLNVLKQHGNIPCISVNVSAVELLATDYSARVEDLLKASGIAADRIELEITEGNAINDLLSEHHLEKLTALGVRIAIDDFGTGETKFDYLARMKVSALKIDLTLVRKFDKAPDSYRPLMTAISSVGKSCGIDIIAEGVETDEQAIALKSIGITKFQGYLFGRSAPAEQFIKTHVR